MKINWTNTIVQFAGGFIASIILNYFGIPKLLQIILIIIVIGMITKKYPEYTWYSKTPKKLFPTSTKCPQCNCITPIRFRVDPRTDDTLCFIKCQNCGNEES